MATTHHTLAKTIRDGRTATVTIETNPRGHLITVARLEGAEVGSHHGPHHKAATLPPGHVAAVGPLCLTQAEADTLTAAWQTAKQAQPRDLHAERRDIVRDIKALAAETVNDPEDLIDQGDPNPYRNVASIEANLAEANERLAAFDAEHPEVAAKVETDRDERVQRFIEAGL